MAVLVATLVANEFVSGAGQMVGAAKSIVTSLTEATNTIQAMESVLISSAGSLSAARVDLGSIREITDSLGTSFEGAVLPFAKFAASATQFKKEQIFTMFEDVSTALAGIHAPARTAEGAFLALQQIVSKGKLSMQDLRRQLAEHIPGSMAKAVRAFGDGKSTYKEFEDAVREGDVVISDFLPKFTELMRVAAEGAAARAAKTLNAEMERTRTSYLLFREELARTSGSTESWIGILKTLQTELFGNEQVMTGMADVMKPINEHVLRLVKGASELVPLIGKLFVVWGEGANKGAELADVFFGLYKGMFDVTTGTRSLSEAWGDYLDKVKNVTGLNAAKHAMEESLALSDRLMIKNREVAEEKLRVEQKIKDDLINAESDKAKLLEAAQLQRVATVKETYEATGELAQEHFDNETALLEAKADTWIAAGVKIADAEAWLEREISTLQKEMNKEVEATIQSYANLEAALKRTIEWTKKAAEEQAASGLSVLIGGKEARWDGDRWVTEDQGPIGDVPEPQQQQQNNSGVGAQITNNFTQKMSKSQVLDITQQQQRDAARY